MTKVVRRTRTEEEEVVQDELALEGWLLEKGGNPDIRAVHVERQADNGTFHRLHRATLLPPFDQDLGPIYEAHGDGLYRFTAVDQRGKLKGSRTVRILGYADQARPGPGGRPGPRSGTDDVLLEAENALRHQVRIATLKATLRDLRADDAAPAGTQGGGLAPEERAVLQEEAFDRSLERTSKLVAMMGGPGKREDQVGMIREVLGLAKEILGGARGNPVSNLKETLELLAVAKDVLGGGDSGEEGWTGIIRDLIRNPQLLQNVRDMVVAERARGPAGPPAGPPPVRYAPPPPRAAPTAPLAPSPAAPANSPPTANHPWEILRTTILPALLEAAARGDRTFGKYAELIDRHLPPAGGRPGALEELTQYDFPTTLERLAQLEPRVREAQAAAWLEEFYTFVRDDYFLPEEEPHGRAQTDGDAPAPGTGGEPGTAG